MNAHACQTNHNNGVKGRDVEERDNVQLLEMKRDTKWWQYVSSEIQIPYTIKVSHKFEPCSYSIDARNVANDSRNKVVSWL